MDHKNTLRVHNGDNNGDEVKTPFLIGVAGGTASGKVNINHGCRADYVQKYVNFSPPYARKSWSSWDRLTWITLSVK